MGKWHWSDDWETHTFSGPDEYSGDKYADMSLYDPKGNCVIPLVIDHYVPRWDTAKGEETNAERRKHIVDALNRYEVLQHVMDRVDLFIEFLQETVVDSEVRLVTEYFEEEMRAVDEYCASL